MTCKDDQNNKVITIFYDQDKVEALGKTFTNVLVFGNGISAEYSTWKSLFLGFGKELDESWKINLEFSKPKSASIIKFKNKNGKSEKLSESSYLLPTLNYYKLKSFCRGVLLPGAPDPVT